MVGLLTNNMKITYYPHRKGFQFQANPSPSVDLEFRSRDDADWYSKSWPNKNGMSLQREDGPYATITNILRDGILVGRRIDSDFGTME